MMKMKYRETMRAIQAPDIYAGETCDQHEPQWSLSTEGDKGDDGIIGDMLELSAKTFPPGTKVLVLEPECPNCRSLPSLMNMPGQSGKWECECEFDWKSFTEETFS